MTKKMLTYAQYRSDLIADDPDYQYSEVEIKEMYSYYTSSFRLTTSESSANVIK